MEPQLPLHAARAASRRSVQRLPCFRRGWRAWAAKCGLCRASCLPNGAPRCMPPKLPKTTNLSRRLGSYRQVRCEPRLPRELLMDQRHPLQTTHAA